MSGSLIPISDEQAKLGQEVLKTLRGLGSFVEKALGSTPEDLIAYFGGDRLRVRRAENLVRLMVEARQRLADWSVEEPIPASLSVALPLLQGAADEDRDELVDLWARLLANAMDPNKNTVRYSFIEIVKQMDVPDALVVRWMHKKNPHYISLSNHEDDTNKVYGHVLLAREISRSNDEVELSVMHLVSLGLLDAQGGPLGHRVNVRCREFMRACYLQK